MVAASLCKIICMQLQQCVLMLNHKNAQGYNWRVTERERDIHRGTGASNSGTRDGLLAELKLRLILIDEWVVLILLDSDHAWRSTVLFN